MVSFQPIQVQSITPRTPLTAIDPAVLLNSLSGLGISQSLTASVPTGTLGIGGAPAARANNQLASLPLAANPGLLNAVNPTQLLAGTPVNAVNPFAGALPGAAAPRTTLVNPNPSLVQGNAQLLTAISKIQRNPEGAQLLQTALAKGYTIRVGDPAAALTGGSPDLAGGNALGAPSILSAGDPASTQAAGCATPGDGCPICMAAAVEAANNGLTVQGLTFSGNRKEIIINPNSTDFDKTLVHELYHAATDNDGDSKVEEATANIIGDRVSASVNGRAPRDPNQIFNETIPLYPGLPFNNR